MTFYYFIYNSGTRDIFLRRNENTISDSDDEESDAGDPDGPYGTYPGHAARVLKEHWVAFNAPNSKLKRPRVGTIQNAESYAVAATGEYSSLLVLQFGADHRVTEYYFAAVKNCPNFYPLPALP